MGGIAVIDTCVIQNFCNINQIDLFDKLKYYLCITIYVELEISNSDNETKRKFDALVKNGTIKNVPLTLEDIVEMSKVPSNKKYSDTELSCIVKAKQINSAALTDDKKAIKFITQYLLDTLIKGTKDILIEGYIEDLLNDVDLKDIQAKLRENRFHLKEDLLFEAAGKKIKLGMA